MTKNNEHLFFDRRLVSTRREGNTLVRMIEPPSKVEGLGSAVTVKVENLNPEDVEHVVATLKPLGDATLSSSAASGDASIDIFVDVDQPGAIPDVPKRNKRGRGATDAIAAAEKQTIANRTAAVFDTLVSAGIITAGDLVNPRLETHHEAAQVTGPNIMKGSARAVNGRRIPSSPER